MRNIAVFPTLTSAQRGCRVVASVGIPAEVVKIDSGRTQRGCSWGIAFPEEDTDNVAVILHNSGLGRRQIIPEYVRR